MIAKQWRAWGEIVADADEKKRNCLLSLHREYCIFTVADSPWMDEKKIAYNLGERQCQILKMLAPTELSILFDLFLENLIL